MTTQTENKYDQWEEFGPYKAELYRKSELVRELRFKRPLTPIDTITLAKESAKVYGRGYLYERIELGKGRNDLFRRVYVLCHYPNVDSNCPYPEGRVDGDANKWAIVGRMDSEKEELSQPTIEELLKNEIEVNVKLEIKTEDMGGTVPYAFYTTHKTYELTPKKTTICLEEAAK